MSAVSSADLISYGTYTDAASEEAVRGAVNTQAWSRFRHIHLYTNSSSVVKLLQSELHVELKRWINNKAT